jgi:hypothetical protein
MREPAQATGGDFVFANESAPENEGPNEPEPDATPDIGGF